MQTVTLAGIYETQGLMDDALEIYQAILQREPNNISAKKGIRRIQGKQPIKSRANEQRLEQFLNLEDQKDIADFEAWLLFAD